MHILDPETHTVRGAQLRELVFRQPPWYIQMLQSLRLMKREPEQERRYFLGEAVIDGKRHWKVSEWPNKRNLFIRFSVNPSDTVDPIKINLEGITDYTMPQSIDFVSTKVHAS